MFVRRRDHGDETEFPPETADVSHPILFLRTGRMRALSGSCALSHESQPFPIRGARKVGWRASRGVRSLVMARAFVSLSPLLTAVPRNSTLHIPRHHDNTTRRPAATSPAPPLCLAINILTSSLRLTADWFLLRNRQLKVELGTRHPPLADPKWDTPGLQAQLSHEERALHRPSPTQRPPCLSLSSLLS